MFFGFRTQIWICVLRRKPADGVEGFAFGEDGSDGVNRVLARFFARFVQKIKDHAIKFAVEEVVSTQILRDLRA